MELSTPKDFTQEDYLLESPTLLFLIKMLMDPHAFLLFKVLQEDFPQIFMTSTIPYFTTPFPPKDDPPQHLKLLYAFTLIIVSFTIFHSQEYFIPTAVLPQKAILLQVLVLLNSILQEVYFMDYMKLTPFSTLIIPLLVSMNSFTQFSLFTTMDYLQVFMTPMIAVEEFTCFCFTIRDSFLQQGVLHELKKLHHVSIMEISLILLLFLPLQLVFKLVLSQLPTELFLLFLQG